MVKLTAENLETTLNRYGIVAKQSFITKADGVGSWVAKVLSVTHESIVCVLTCGENVDRVTWSTAATLEQIDNGHLKVIDSIVESPE